MKNYSLLSMLALACLIQSFYGCSSTPPEQNTTVKKNEAKKTEPASSNTVREITFRLNVPVGYKYTTVTRESGRFQPGDKETVVKTTTTFELVKAEAGRNTWKSLTTQEIEDIGDAKQGEGQGLDVNRLVYVVTDISGNTLSTEGEDSGKDTLNGQEWPTHSIKVGDTWSCTTKNKENGKETVSNYQLEAIETINGNDYAIIHDEFSGESAGSGTRWVDLTSGIQVKFEYESEKVNFAGNPYTQKAVLNVLNADGQPIL